MRIAVFGKADSVSLVDRYQRFGELCCLHLQGEERKKREISLLTGAT
jgi:hypothetical protein